MSNMVDDKVESVFTLDEANYEICLGRAGFMAGPKEFLHALRSDDSLLVLSDVTLLANAVANQIMVFKEQELVTVVTFYRPSAIRPGRTASLAAGQIIPIRTGDN